MESIIFTTETGEQETFYVLEQTVLGGMTYLLVADSDDEEEEANAMILKDVSSPEDEYACYVVVEDETEVDAVSGVFEEMMEDVSFQ